MGEMVKIPYGETRSYRELASSEKERVPENPPVLPVATGTEALNSLGGYVYGTVVKEKLLKLEK